MTAAGNGGRFDSRMIPEKWTPVFGKGHAPGKIELSCRVVERSPRRDNKRFPCRVVECSPRRDKNKFPIRPLRTQGPDRLWSCPPQTTTPPRIAIHGGVFVCGEPVDGHGARDLGAG